MPIEPIKTLADLLVSLFNERKRHRLAVFEKHVTPCYEAAKRVFDDYMDYYNELEGRLSGGEPLSKILAFVKARRLERLSDREELRAALHDQDSAPVEPFDAAVLGLVSGSQTVNHEFNHFRASLEAFILFNERQERDESAFRETLIATVRRQMKFITLQYRSVAKEYAGARSNVSER